mgnify:FL=1|jgi:hypothetical protein
MDIKESPLVSSELIFLRIFSVPNGNEYSTIIFHDRVIITPFLSPTRKIPTKVVRTQADIDDFYND